jgi:hypothetical protein
MWAPSHMNKIFFEQMLIHQFKLFQALVAINDVRSSPWPAGSDGLASDLRGVTLEK